MNDERAETADSKLDAVVTRHHIVTRVTTFVRDLRRAGADVPANAGVDAMEALTVVGIEDRRRVQVALRTTLVSSQADSELFDRLFPPFWDTLRERVGTRDEERDRTRGQDGRATAAAATRSAHSDETRDVRSSDSGSSDSGSSTNRTELSKSAPNRHSDDGSQESPTERTVERSDTEPNGIESRSSPPSDSNIDRRRTDVGEGVDSDDGGDDTGQSTASAYSRIGSSTPVDVGDVTDAERLDEAVEKVRRSLSTVQHNRWTRNTTGNRIDMRRALRRAFATGGTVTEVPRQTRRTTRVQCLLLVDVSRSVLDTINRGFLIRFLRSVSEVFHSVRIFVFDTSAREVTEQFEAASAADAVRALQRAETEWGGGTRIGHAIESIRRTSPYAVDRSTTVFVISDGLEVGEIDLLEEGIAWLARLSSALLWLNPLAASPSYEPTVEGMAVSLPYLDGLFAFTDIEDVEEIGRQLRIRNPGTKLGYQHDQRRRNDRAVDGS